MRCKSGMDPPHQVKGVSTAGLLLAFFLYKSEGPKPSPCIKNSTISFRYLSLTLIAIRVTLAKHSLSYTFLRLLIASAFLWIPSIRKEKHHGLFAHLVLCYLSSLYLAKSGKKSFSMAYTSLTGCYVCLFWVGVKTTWTASQCYHAFHIIAVVRWLRQWGRVPKLSGSQFIKQAGRESADSHPKAEPQE
jgi:hypothetical protein